MWTIVIRKSLKMSSLYLHRTTITLCAQYTWHFRNIRVCTRDPHYSVVWLRLRPEWPSRLCSVCAQSVLGSNRSRFGDVECQCSQHPIRVATHSLYDVMRASPHAAEICINKLHHVNGVWVSVFVLFGVCLVLYTQSLRSCNGCTYIFQAHDARLPRLLAYAYRHRSQLCNAQHSPSRNAHDDGACLRSMAPYASTRAWIVCGEFLLIECLSYETYRLHDFIIICNYSLYYSKQSNYIGLILKGLTRIFHMNSNQNVTRELFQVICKQKKLWVHSISSFFLLIHSI